MDTFSIIKNDEFHVAVFVRSFNETECEVISLQREDFEFHCTLHKKLEYKLGVMVKEEFEIIFNDDIDEEHCVYHHTDTRFIADKLDQDVLIYRIMVDYHSELTKQPTPSPTYCTMDDAPSQNMQPQVSHLSNVSDIAHISHSHRMNEAFAFDANDHQHVGIQIKAEIKTPFTDTVTKRSNAAVRYGIMDRNIKILTAAKEEKERERGDEQLAIIQRVSKENQELKAEINLLNGAKSLAQHKEFELRLKNNRKQIMDLTNIEILSKQLDEMKKELKEKNSLLLAYEQKEELVQQILASFIKAADEQKQIMMNEILLLKKNVNEIKEENVIFAESLTAVIMDNAEINKENEYEKLSPAKEAIQKELFEEKPLKSTASTMATKCEKNLDLNGFIGFVLLIIAAIVYLGLMITDWIGSFGQIYVNDDQLTNAEFMNNVDLKMEKEEDKNRNVIFYDESLFEKRASSKHEKVENMLWNKVNIMQHLETYYFIFCTLLFKDWMNIWNNMIGQEKKGRMLYNWTSFRA